MADELISLVGGAITTYEERKDVRHIYIAFGILITAEKMADKSIYEKIMKMLGPYKDLLTFD